MVAITGQACTLRCKDCGNMTPHVDDPSKRFYDMDGVIRCLDALLRHSTVKLLQIQGGEAFLHPHLGILLRHVAETDRIVKCQVATNGTLIPSSDEVAILKNPKFSIRISNYPIFSKRANELKSLLDSNGLRNRMYSFVQKTGLWYDLGNTLVCGGGDAQAASRFATCKYNHCLTLENSRLAYCSRATISDSVQGFSESDDDYLYVSDTADFGEKLKRYVRNPHFMEACRHCNGTDGTPTLEPAIQLDGQYGGPDELSESHTAM